MTARMSNEQKAVRRGARMLDKIEPGWFNRIDLDTFDLSSSCLCVLGQMFEPEVHAMGADGAYDFVAECYDDDPDFNPDWEHEWGYTAGDVQDGFGDRWGVVRAIRVKLIEKSPTYYGFLEGYDDDDGSRLRYSALSPFWIEEIEARR